MILNGCFLCKCELTQKKPDQDLTGKKIDYSDVYKGPGKKSDYSDGKVTILISTKGLVRKLTILTSTKGLVRKLTILTSVKAHTACLSQVC